MGSEAPLAVLLIDDDVSLHDLVRAVFTHLVNGEVECVRTGVEALPLLLHGKWDVILLDLLLPGMDGFTVLDRLESQRPSLMSRVVVVSAIPRKQMEHLDGRVFRLVEKPFEIEAFADVCAQCARQPQLLV